MSAPGSEEGSAELLTFERNREGTGRAGSLTFALRTSASRDRLRTEYRARPRATSEGGGTFGCRSSQPFNHPLSRPVDRKGSGSAGCANGSLMVIDPTRKGRNHIMESLILAQNERWRRVLSMQVERQLW